VVGATAIAATPVNPIVPSLAEMEQRAVSLAASTGPLNDLATLFQGTLTNVGVLGGSVLNTTIPAVAQAITNPEIYGDFINFLGSNALNPLPLLQQLVGFPGTYGGVIGAGMQAGSVALQERLSQLPTVLTNTFNFLSTGQFVEAFSEVNVWFLVSIERALVPLLPTLQVPGDILASLPNGQRLAAVFDTLLKRGVFTEFTRSILGPAASAGLQMALVLDDIRSAVVSGDFGTVANELVGLPIKVVNAFVNGFVPPFASRSPWTGILGDRGTLDYFLVDLPKALADAFNNPVFPVTPPPVTTPPATQSLVASTDLALSADAVSLAADADLKVTTPVTGATPVTEVSLPTEVPAEAPVETPAETPTETTIPDVEDDATAGTDTAGEATDADGTDSGAGTGSGTAGGGTADDTKSDDTKPDDTKSDDTKPEKPKSDKTTSDKTTSDKTKSDKTPSDKTTSNKTTSGATKAGASKSDASKSGGSDSGSSDSGSNE
jgi:hypothetical protein